MTARKHESTADDDWVSRHEKDIDEVVRPASIRLNGDVVIVRYPGVNVVLAPDAIQARLAFIGMLNGGNFAKLKMRVASE